MRIGIMGGTFNPVHFGHLNSAEEIADIFKMDKIIFVPAYIPPHKNIEGILDSKDRLNMLKLSVKSNKRFSVSTIEIDRGGVSYSIDTISEIKALYKDAPLFFIVGTDIFSDISTWRSPELLLRGCNFVVNRRAYYKYSIEDIIASLRKDLENRGGDISFRYDGKDGLFGAEKISISASDYSLYIVNTTEMNISSTVIRDRVRNSRSIKYLLPESVEKYIVKNRLYI